VRQRDSEALDARAAIAITSGRDKEATTLMKLAIVFAGQTGNFKDIDLVPVGRIKKLEEDGLIKHWNGDVYCRTDAGRRAAADKLGVTASYRNHVLAGWRTATEILREAGYQVTLPAGVKE
jgi:hypothetical protein